MTGLHSGPTTGAMSTRQAWKQILPPQFDSFFNMPLLSGEHTHLLDWIQRVFSKPDLLRSLTVYREEMSTFIQREGEAWYDAGNGNNDAIDFEEDEDDIIDDEDLVSPHDNVVAIDSDIPRIGKAHYSGEPTPVTSNSNHGAYQVPTLTVTPLHHGPTSAVRWVRN